MTLRGMTSFLACVFPRSTTDTSYSVRDIREDTYLLHDLQVDNAFPPVGSAGGDSCARVRRVGST